jgi:prevent-host-death family protein
MRALHSWTAADAKVSFSEVLDLAHAEPQLILRHGKPVGVVIDWDLYQSRRSALLPGFDSWLAELSNINQREGEFDLPPRLDRSEIGQDLP